MGKEMVVSHGRHETKVAILEEGSLVEIYFQRENEYSLAGSIHKGRVTRVLPGMQSAFVDLGLERDAFLYVSDFIDEHGEDVDQVADERPARPNSGNERGRERNRDAGRRGYSPPPIAVVTPALEPEPAGAMKEAALEEAVVPPIPVELPVNGAVGGGRDSDRRGRRRRRNRSRGGLPESKFAAAPVAGDPMEREEADDELPGDEAPSAEPLPEQVLLPGESRRKHRMPVPSAMPAPLAVAPFVEPQVVPVEETPEQEQAVTDLIEAQVEAEQAAAGGLIIEDDRDAAADAAQEAAEAELQDGVEEVEEGDEEGDEDPEAVVESETPADGEAPPLAATGSAHVREQSGRFLQQRGRRNRRGRGSRPMERSPERGGAEEAPAARAQQNRDSGAARDAGVRPPLPSISDLLKEGQEILVQIAKEPIGSKGARITSHIALPGRYCVYMPTVDHAGVSRKIASDEERQRLKKIVQTHRQGMSGGFILRTAGEGKTEEDLAADMTYLYNLWLDIRQKAEKKPAPALIHHDLEIVERIMRDQLTDEYKSVWVDHEDLYEQILRYVQRVQPQFVQRVKLYTRSAPIFDSFGITAELEKALKPKVWLKSGGYIVINQTEALVAVDINTGKYTGKSNRLEDTIVKTNTDAIREIVRQIRLRDLGGIIVIDFIDMDERKNRQKVMQTLEEAMRADRAPYKILQFNDFGLVAITRKRVKQSLERTLCQPCTWCEGSGYIKSVATVIGDILHEARKIAAAVEGKECVLRANPEVAKVLKSTSNKYLEELEEVLRRPVLVVADVQLHHEKFDLS